MSVYFVEFFDKNHIRPNILVTVEGVSNKRDAIAAARVKFVNQAEKDVRTITEGMAHLSVDLGGSKAVVRNVSPEYYQYLALQNWGISWCDSQDKVAKGVSSESAVAKADAALEVAQRECDSDAQGDSSVTRRKKHWTAAEKKAAAAKRAAAKAAKRAAAERAKARKDGRAGKLQLIA